MKSVSINFIKRIVLLTLVLTMTLTTTCQFLNVSYNAEAISYTIPNGTYWIINAHTGKALTVYNSGTTAGTNVVQSDNVNGTNQRWQVITNTNTSYPNRQFTLILAEGTYGKCLAAASSTMSNGVNIQLSNDCTAATSNWDIYKPSTKGNYMIMSKISSNFVAAVENSSNTNVYINTYNGADYCNDEWIFVPVSDGTLVTATVKVQLDSSIRTHYLNDVSSETRAIFADATKPFYNKFHIQLTPTFYNLQSVPADDCPNTSYMTMCNPSNVQCGANSVCHNGNSLPNHHKNLYYNALSTYANTSKGGFDLRLVMTAQNACYINSSGTHSNGILGLCWKYDGNMIVKCNEYSRGHMLNVRVIQHELSHAFGCPDHDDEGENCIMSGGFDENYTYNLETIWCSDCEAIMEDRNIVCLTEE